MVLQVNNKAISARHITSISPILGNSYYFYFSIKVQDEKDFTVSHHFYPYITHMDDTNTPQWQMAEAKALAYIRDIRSMIISAWAHVHQPRAVGTALVRDFKTHDNLIKVEDFRND